MQGLINQTYVLEEQAQSDVCFLSNALTKNNPQLNILNKTSVSNNRNNQDSKLIVSTSGNKQSKQITERDLYLRYRFIYQVTDITLQKKKERRSKLKSKQRKKMNMMNNNVFLEMEQLNINENESYLENVQDQKTLLLSQENSSQIIKLPIENIRSLKKLKKVQLNPQANKLQWMSMLEQLSTEDAEKRKIQRKQKAQLIYYGKVTHLDDQLSENKNQLQNDNTTSQFFGKQSTLNRSEISQIMISREQSPCETVNFHQNTVAQSKPKINRILKSQLYKYAPYNEHLPESVKELNHVYNYQKNNQNKGDLTQDNVKPRFQSSQHVQLDPNYRSIYKKNCGQRLNSESLQKVLISTKSSIESKDLSCSDTKCANSPPIIKINQKDITFFHQPEIEKKHSDTQQSPINSSCNSQDAQNEDLFNIENGQINLRNQQNQAQSAIPEVSKNQRKQSKDSVTRSISNKKQTSIRTQQVQQCYANALQDFRLKTKRYGSNLKANEFYPYTTQNSPRLETTHTSQFSNRIHMNKRRFIQTRQYSPILNEEQRQDRQEMPLPKKETFRDSSRQRKPQNSSYQQEKQVLSIHNNDLHIYINQPAFYNVLSPNFEKGKATQNDIINENISQVIENSPKLANLVLQDVIKQNQNYQLRTPTAGNQITINYNQQAPLKQQSFELPSLSLTSKRQSISGMQSPMLKQTLQQKDMPAEYVIAKSSNQKLNQNRNFERQISPYISSSKDIIYRQKIVLQPSKGK